MGCSTWRTQECRLIQEAKGQKSEADKVAHVREGFESCHNASKRDNTLAVAKSGRRALAALLGKNRISARTRRWEKRLEIFVGENGKAVYLYKLPDGAIIQCNKERIAIKNGKSSIKRILCSKIVADYKE